MKGAASAISARLLAIASALNLNGLFEMTLGIGQIASIILLVCSIHLIWKHGRAAWSLPFALIMSAFVAYLVFGTVIADPLYAPPPFDYYRTYVGSMTLVWAIAAYTAWLGYGPRLEAYLAFVRNAFVVTAASVWASPLLYSFYVNLPPSHYERLSGFFENPNEAGFAACIALALTLALPYRQASYQTAALLLAIGATTLTLSKGAMTAGLIVLAWQLLWRWWGALMVACMAILLLLTGPRDVDVVLDGIADRLELNDNQRQRLLDVGKILGAEIDSDVTTSRSDLWQIGLERAWSKFPFGNGLGSFHFMRGGIAEDDVWMGVHNAFLMIWGEAGVVPALLLIAGLAAAVLVAVLFSLGGIELPILIIVIADMTGAHDALGLRYNDLALGVTLGLAGLGVASWHRACRARFVFGSERPR